MVFSYLDALVNQTLYQKILFNWFPLMGNFNLTGVTSCLLALCIIPN